MSNVHELFPVARGSPESEALVDDSPVREPGFMEWFIDDPLPNTLYLIACLEEATSEQEFRERMAVVQQDVAAWPTE